MPFGFIGGTEIFWVILIGLMLFGGKLPDVAKDLGQIFFRAKRTLHEVRKESGIDDALKEIRREAQDLQRESQAVDRSFREAATVAEAKAKALDLSAGPGGKEEVEDVENEKDSPTESEADSQEASDPEA